MLERCISNQWTVVQFEDGEAFCCAAASRQLTNSIIGYQFAMRKCLSEQWMQNVRKEFRISIQKCKLQVFPSLDIRLLNVPTLDLLFDCTLPDPFSPSICSSTSKTFRINFFRSTDSVFIFVHLSQRLESNVGKLMAPRHFQRAQMWIVIGQSHQRRIAQFTALADAQLT